MGSSPPNAIAETPLASDFGHQPFDRMLCSCCQRGADAWVWREDWRAYYAKSPTSRSYPEKQSLEQGTDHRSETSAASQTSVGYPRDPALFNLAIDRKLHGCDLVSLTFMDQVKQVRVLERVSVIQSKTKRSVHF